MKLLYRFLEDHAAGLLFITLTLIVISTSLSDFLLFHSLIEFTITSIAFLIFILAWYSRKISDNKYFLSLGIVFLFVAIAEMLHTLSYDGMGVFPYDANMSTQFWLTARYLQTAGLFVSPFLIRKKFNPAVELFIFALISTILFYTIFKGIFPASYVEGVGLTDFKKISEYIISFTMLVSIFLFIRKRKNFDTDTLIIFIVSIVFAIASELIFTLYTNVFGTINIMGHVLALISFFLIFRSLVDNVFVKPYTFIFKDLENKNRGIEILNKNLIVLNKILRHDILNDLTVIMGNAELFLRKKKNDLLENIYQSAHKSENLIAQIRDAEATFTASKSELKKYQLKRVLNKLIKEHPEVSFEVEGNADVMADQVIYSVFENLIVNAIVHGKTKKIDINIEGNDNFVNVSFKDYGKGIPKNLGRKIFKEGVTFGEHGSGIGLYIIKQTLQRYGGKVDYARKRKTGATFYLKFPKA